MLHNAITRAGACTTYCSVYAPEHDQQGVWGNLSIKWPILAAQTIQLLTINSQMVIDLGQAPLTIM